MKVLTMHNLPTRSAVGAGGLLIQLGQFGGGIRKELTAQLWVQPSEFVNQLWGQTNHIRLLLEKRLENLSLD